MGEASESLPMTLGKKKHVLVAPLCLQSHFSGLYRHAVELAKRGVVVTFLGLGKDIALLRKAKELRGLDFNLITYEEFESENRFQFVGDVVEDFFEYILSSRKVFQPILDKLVADQKAGLPGPTCLISDWILTWALGVARELNIPYFQFYSAGAIYPRDIQARGALFADGTLTWVEGQSGLTILGNFKGYLKSPGLPAYEYRDMINCPVTDTKGVMNTLDITLARMTPEVDGLIVNTFYELEAPQIDALQQTWRDNFHGKKVPKTFLVGPLPNVAIVENLSIASDMVNSDTDCLSWLDRRPPRSVVYVCIGRVGNFTPQTVGELALGLEASEQWFLLVTSRGGPELLPPDFEARTRERGLTITGWVPQLQILQHSAIGGFVTHCGWNSIIESICSGVPMAAWPQIACDQVANSRYIVDVLKVAVEVRHANPYFSAAGQPMGAPGSAEKGVPLEKALRLLLSDEGQALRSRAEELKKKAEAVRADGGARTTALNELVECIPP